MTDRALIERLRALSAWLQERNLDMEMPAGMIDPAEAADRLEALTGGEAVACADCPGHGGNREDCCELLPPAKPHQSRATAVTHTRWVSDLIDSLRVLARPDKGLIFSARHSYTWDSYFEIHGENARQVDWLVHHAREIADELEQRCYLSPPSGRGVGREEIARVIDPEGWALRDHLDREFGGGYSPELSASLDRSRKTADAILALFSSPSLGGEGKQEDSSSGSDLSSASRSPTQSPDGPPMPADFVEEVRARLTMIADGEHLRGKTTHFLGEIRSLDDIVRVAARCFGRPSAPDPQAQQDVGER